MSLLQTMFDETFTHPEISAAITSRLTHFRQHSHPHLPTTVGHEVRLATLAQDNIGWKNFLEGLASKKWGLPHNDTIPSNTSLAFLPGNGSTSSWHD